MLRIEMDATKDSASGKRILFLDDHVPYPELGVGFPRARKLLQTLHDQGHAITFVPLECPVDDGNPLRRAVPDGVEVIFGVGPQQLKQLLQSRAQPFDLFLVSRPNNMRSLVGALEQLAGPIRNTPILYDAEAVFALREVLRREIEG